MLKTNIHAYKFGWAVDIIKDGIVLTTKNFSAKESADSFRTIVENSRGISVSQGLIVLAK